MRDVELIPHVRRQARRRAHVVQRTEQQRQRRAELVTDVAEERRLRAIDFGERLGAPAFLCIGMRVGETRRQLSDQQTDEAAHRVVDRTERIQPGDEHAVAPLARLSIGSSMACVGGRDHAPRRQFAEPIVGRAD